VAQGFRLHPLAAKDIGIFGDISQAMARKPLAVCECRTLALFVRLCVFLIKVTNVLTLPGVLYALPESTIT
jgi:hypothetical protein